MASLGEHGGGGDRSAAARSGASRGVREKPGHFAERLHLRFPCFMLLCERGGTSRPEQSEEAGDGKIATNIQWVGGSAQEQRDAPRLSRDADGRGAFEPVRRADLRRHGGFREEQRGGSAPIHASGARPAEPRLLLPG